MPEDTQGQAELEPGEVVATPTEEVAPEPQAIDYAALEEKAAGLGEGYSLSNLADKYESARREMNDAQRNSVDIERKYEPVRPLIDKLQSDPAFAAKLQSAAQEYFDGGTEFQYKEAPNEVNQTLDPVYQRLSTMETQLAGEKMDREIDRLRGDGMPIDDAAYNKIMQRVVDTRNDDVQAHAWSILGPSMVSNAAKQATTDVADKIKGNSSKYIPTPGGGTSTKPYDVKQMSQEDIDNDMMAELTEKMSGG